MSKTLKNTFAAVMAVAFLMFGFAATTQALTQAEADAIILALGLSGAQADVINGLVVGGGSSSSSSMSCMAYGLPGVMGIQKAVNHMGYSPALVEDGVSGPKTKAGVMWAQGVLGVVADGAWGPKTDTAYKAWVNNNCSDDDSSSSSSSSSSNGELDFDGQEADIEDSDTKSGDNNIYANDMYHIATFEIDLDNQSGDMRIDRVDMMFTLTSTPDENDLYDVFNEISIMVDGDKVAEEKTDDEDDWRDLANSDSEGTFRFLGVDYVMEGGDKTEFDVYAEIADLDNDDDLDLDVEVEFEIRYTDGAGIIDTYAISGTEVFTIEAVDAIEFDLDENNDNPEDETLSLNDAQDDVVVLFNDVTVDEQSGTVEDITVTFVTSSDLSAEEINDLIDDVKIKVDGDAFEADTINDFTATGFTATFDDIDMDVDVDDEFELEVWVSFEDLDTGSVFIGETVEVESVTFEGTDQTDEDFSVTENANNAPVMTLSGGALIVESTDIEGYDAFGSASAQVVFEVEVDYDGDEDGVVIADADAFLFDLVDPAGNTGTDLTALTDVDGFTGYSVTVEYKDGSSEETLGTDFVVDSKETFIVTVTVNATTAAASGKYEIELVGIEWAEWTDADNDDVVDGGETGSTEELDLSLEADDINLEEQV